MAGTVTQSRTLKHPLPYVYAEEGFPLKTGDWDRSATQTTTSYRSGRSELPTEAEPIPTSRGAAFKQYRREYKENQRPYDRGHPFSTQKQIFTCNYPSYLIRGSASASGKSWYRGPLIIQTSPTLGSRNAGFYGVPAFDSSFYGTRAIAATAPTNPVANLAVSLAETKREGLPKLGGAEFLKAKSLADRRRAAGGEYLNVEFGWKPLLGAINETMHAVDQAEQIMRQYRRDSGKWVRRSYEFPSEVLDNRTFTRPNSAQALLNMPNAFSWTNGNYFSNGRTGNVTETIEVTRRVYFKGAYTYHLPQEPDHVFWKRMNGYREKAQHLLGLDINPEVLWNLQPWSWLVDWEGNLGANISAFTALSTDSLVIVYGYLMAETKSVHSYTLSGVQTTHQGTLPDILNTYTTLRKERVKATPYGFGRNPASFSGRQWSILGALGLSKTPGTLM